MNEITQTVLSLISHVLFKKPLPSFSPSLDWNAVYEECRVQSVATLFADILEQLPISEELRLKWSYVCVRGRQHSLSILRVQNEIHSLFSSNNINYAVLKGFAAACYYPEPEYRTMGDLDIIVHPSDFDRAQLVLQKNGFESTFDPDCYNFRHVPYKKNGVEIELHHFFAQSKDEHQLDLLLNNMIEGALPCSVVQQHSSSESYCFKTLPKIENGLVLLNHIVQHIPSGLGYRQIIDFLLYANKHLDDSAWYGAEGFCICARELHMEKLAKICVRMGQLYFGMDDEVSWCKDVDESLCKELLDYLTSSGNFGRKNETGDERITRVIRAAHGSPFLILKHEQEAGLKYWKAVKKHPALKPFAWIYGCCRHLKMLIKGKRVREALKKISTGKDSAAISKLLDL